MSKHLVVLAKKYFHFDCLVFFIFSAIGTLSFVALTSFLLENSVFAVNGTVSTTSDVTVRLTEIISLRIVDSTATSELDTLNLGLTPTPNGAFTKGSFIADASTSNATGYKLYMTSLGQNHSGNYTTSLINTDTSIDDTTESSIGNIPTLDFSGTSSTSITEAEFRVSNSAYKNRWGYSTNGLIITSTTEGGVTTNTITENTDTSTITYRDIPAHGVTREIDDKIAAVEHGLTPVTIGTNVTNAKAAGAYQNTLELTAIANPLTVDYSLSFDGNSTGTVTGLPSAMEASSVASSYTFTIPSNVPTTSVTGYAFKEWNTAADGSGDSYSPGDDFTVSADDIAGTDQVLYAIWEENNFWTITYMQDMTPEICAAVTTPDKTAAQTDVDGSHHGDTAYVAQRTLYDVRDMQSYIIRKLADGNCWMARNLAIGCNGTGSTYGSDFSTKTLTPTDSNVEVDYTTSTARLGNSYDIAQQTCNSTYGAWYNYAAASAGTISGTSNSNTLEHDICPAGWKIPPSPTISDIKVFQLEPTKGGSFLNGSLQYGQYGAYWNSNVYNESYRYFMFYNGDNGTLANLNGVLTYFYRSSGHYIRCIVK